MEQSSTSKGDDFELVVFNYFKNLIDRGQFIASDDCCEIFHKKGYYSKDRSKKIIFDVTIEIYMPGASQYSMLWVIECKNYKRPVSASVAEVLTSQMEQVAGANTKGIIASTNSFQEGAFNYAESKGIGLLRYVDSPDLKWELRRSPSSLNVNPKFEFDPYEVRRGLMSDTCDSRYYDIFGYGGGKYTNSVNDLLSNITSGDAESESIIYKASRKSSYLKPVVRYVESNDVESISKDILERIDYKGGKVDLDQICDAEVSAGNLSVMYESRSAEEEGLSILGKIRFDPSEITIFNDPSILLTRQRFTLAHELGHHFLGHGYFMSSEYFQESDLYTGMNYKLQLKDLVRLEWQANYFASCILLPTRSFVSVFSQIAKAMNINDRGHGIMYLDHQECNLQTYFSVTDRLRDVFGVSRQVVKIKLKKLGILKESSNYAASPIGSLLQGWD